MRPKPARVWPQPPATTKTATSSGLPARALLCEDRAVPRLRPTNPIGMALTAFELWRRLPPRQRKRVLEATRKHGPKVAAALLARSRRTRSSR